MLGRRVRQRDPPLQTVRDFEAALHKEWARLSQRQIKILIQRMRRRLEAVVRVRGGYTKY